MAWNQPCLIISIFPDLTWKCQLFSRLKMKSPDNPDTHLCKEFCHSCEHNSITISTIESVFWQERPSNTSSCPWLPIRTLLRKGLKSSSTSLRRDPDDLNPISSFSDKLRRLKSTEPFRKLGIDSSSSQENTSSSTSAEALRWPPQLAARDRLSDRLWTSPSDIARTRRKTLQLSWLCFGVKQRYSTSFVAN